MRIEKAVVLFARGVSGQATTLSTCASFSAGFLQCIFPCPNDGDRGLQDGHSRGVSTAARFVREHGPRQSTLSPFIRLPLTDDRLGLGTRLRGRVHGFVRPKVG